MLIHIILSAILAAPLPPRTAEYRGELIWQPYDLSAGEEGDFGAPRGVIGVVYVFQSDRFAGSYYVTAETTFSDGRHPLSAGDAMALRFERDCVVKVGYDRDGRWRAAEVVMIRRLP